MDKVENLSHVHGLLEKIHSLYAARPARYLFLDLGL